MLDKLISLFQFIYVQQCPVSWEILKVSLLDGGKRTKVLFYNLMVVMGLGNTKALVYLLCAYDYS